MQQTKMWIAFALFSAVALRAEDLQKPLVISSQGSFFVGGETKTSSALSNTAPANGGAQEASDVTINQMYVQFQVPANATKHIPVVMVHGCCLSSKTWETTPDGRMGWNEYFLRKGRPVYLADQSGRARSGFDATKINAIKLGTVPAAQMPNIFMASHQVAWTIFRFGPKYGTAFSDEQFPVDAADELYKQMIPDLNGLLPTPNPTYKNMAALAVKLNGAVLMGHSESGFYPEEAALTDPSAVRGIVSIEMPCTTNLTPQQLAVLAKIPTLVMFGDHLADAPVGVVSWKDAFDTCQTFVKQVKAAGGDAVMMHLPEMGIKGNSHMLMQDKNNLQLADLILKWTGEHVENGKKSHR